LRSERPYRVLGWLLVGLVSLSAGATRPGSAELLDLNTADAVALAELPGVGPTIAGRIVEYREEHGLFGSVEELLEVRGIGQKTLEKLRPLVRVGSGTPRSKQGPADRPPRGKPAAPEGAAAARSFTAEELLGPPAQLSKTLSVHFSTPSVPADPPLDQVFAALLDRSKRTVDGAFFEINAEPIVDAIERAAERGVQVRLVTDADELKAEPQILSRLKKAGVRFVPDTREALMHHKFAIFDGQAVWSGSYNITRNDTERNDNNALWLHSRELAAIYQAVFEKLWSGNFGADRLQKPADGATLEDGTRVEVFFAPEEAVELQVLKVLRAASSSIDVMAFSFTDEAMGEALISAAARGVRVRVVIEKIASDAKGGQLFPLRDAGVEAYADGNKYRLHHKVFLVDAQTVITGSFNFSRGARSNNENLLILRSSPALARAYQAEFDRVLAEAKTAQ
jgi:competence ComEA-like helix-hairpin-helix protein